MIYLKCTREMVLQFLLFILLSACSLSSVSQGKPASRKITGPKYRTTYEYSIVHNAPIPETVWKANIDWISENFR